MTKNDDKIYEAKAIFDSGFNCCQAVFVPFAMEAGVDEKTSLEIASGFAAGLCYSGETCGAVIGAQMAIGLNKGYSEPEDQVGRENVKSIITTYRKAFLTKYETTQCRDLLGADASTIEGLAFIKGNDACKAKCHDFVADSVKIVESLL